MTSTDVATQAKQFDATEIWAKAMAKELNGGV